MSILKENNIYSFTRILAAVGVVAFLLGSAYLIITCQTWGNYETFATMTGGGSAATQIANKLINSKFNTPQGEAGKPVEK